METVEQLVSWSRMIFINGNGLEYDRGGHVVCVLQGDPNAVTFMATLLIVMLLSMLTRRRYIRIYKPPFLFFVSETWEFSQLTYGKPETKLTITQPRTHHKPS